ncbi:MAG: endonuclease/exonuclease/phosphatase family protein [Caulobacteraceae bacterium]|nr:endonuclease/exonuclease/phosphatase family protein [Caulobacteraceae bacterium]
MNRRRNLIILITLGRLAGWIMLAVAATCLAIGLLGQAGRLDFRLDLLNQLCPLWLAPGLAAAAIAVLSGGRRRLPGAIIAGALILIGGILLGPDLLAHRTRSAPRHDMLRVVQFNVMKENQDTISAVDWIIAQHADVIVLEEAAGDAGAIADALKRLYPYAADCSTNGLCSTMILSRLPPTDSRPLARDDPENRRGLSAVWASFASPAGPYTVVGVHLMRPWPMGKQHDQLRELGDDIAGLPSNRLIIAGDFNASPWSMALREEDRRFGLERRTRLIRTWPARFDDARQQSTPFPLLALDQIYAGPGWATVSMRRGPSLGSDHYPLVIDLAPISADKTH